MWEELLVVKDPQSYRSATQVSVCQCNAYSLLHCPQVAQKVWINTVLHLNTKTQNNLIKLF